MQDNVRRTVHTVQHSYELRTIWMGQAWCTGIETKTSIPSLCCTLRHFIVHITHHIISHPISDYTLHPLILHTTQRVALHLKSHHTSHLIAYITSYRISTFTLLNFNICVITPHYIRDHIHATWLAYLMFIRPIAELPDRREKTDYVTRRNNWYKSKQM